MPDGSRSGTLSITAKIAEPWYTYSTTQKPKGALPTKLTVDASDDYRVTGDFRSTLPPKVIHEIGLTLEEFAGEVTWQAPVEFGAAADINKLTVSGSAKLQVCRVGTCLPPEAFAFTATARAEQKPVSIVEYTNPHTHVTIRGYLEPRVATPGSTVKLVLSADPAAGWHIYALASARRRTTGQQADRDRAEQHLGLSDRSAPRPPASESKDRRWWPAWLRSRITKGR